MADHAGRAVFAQPFPDDRGNRQVGLVVAVYLRGTLTPATLYADADKTGGPIAGNSFATDGLGNAFPYLDPGDYDAHVPGGVVPFSVLPDARDTADTAQLDAAVQAEEDARIAADDAEAAARLAADNAEASARELAAVALQDAIDAETVARQVAVAGEAGARDAAVDAEAAARAAAVDAEQDARVAADNAEAAARIADVQAEEDARVAASIAETLARQTAIAAEAAARTDAIAVESAARAAADAELSADLDALAAADVVLQAADNAEAAARIADVQAEEDARVAAISTEAAARVAADTAESTARVNADNTEAASRSAADAAEAAARTDAIATEATARTNAIAVESNARASGDTDLAADVAALAAADVVLQTNINTRQPGNSNLTAVAALTTTPFGRGLLELASAALARATLGLGTAATQDSTAFDPAGAAAAVAAGAQPLSSNLTALAAVASTGYGRSFLALADVLAARTLLGLGTMATQAANAVAITGGSVAGINDLAVADGGTGASTPAAARNNLGLGTAATAAATDFATPADVAAEAAARAAAVNSRLALTGGTLTGPLTLPADPTADLDAATKQYVDAAAGSTDFAADLMRRQRVIDISAPTYGGILGNDTGNDGPSIQNALNDWAANGGILSGPSDVVCRTTQGLIVPSGASERFYILNGNGMKIHGVGAIDIFADTLPADTATASQRTNRKFVLEDFKIIGDGSGGAIGTVGQRGLVLRGTSQAELGGVRVEYCDINYDLIFALNAKLTDCFAKYGATYDYKIRSGAGEWADANGPNSASNITSLDNCRSYGRQGATAQFYIYQSGEVSMTNCTTEGGHPVDAIVFDRGGNTTTIQFNLKNWHPENAPTNSHLKILGGAAQVVLKAVDWTQGNTMIDATGATGDIHLVHCPRFNGVFNHGASAVGGACWHFTYSGGIGADPTAAALWAGGIVPIQLGGERFSGGSEGYGGSYPMVFGNTLFAMKAETFGFASTQVSPKIAATLPAATAIALWSAAANPATVGTSTFFVWRDEATGVLNLVYKDSAGTSWTVPIDYKSGAILSSSLVQTVTIAGTSYTLVATDPGKMLKTTSASAVTITVPPVASVPIPVGSILNWHQHGAGQITFAPGAGVTLENYGTKLKSAGSKASGGLWHKATDVWVPTGELST